MTIPLVNSPITQAIAAATNWQFRTNENFQSLGAGALYGIEPSLTTGLTLSYFGGQFNGNTVANGTVTLTASATNYVVASLSTGAVSVATTTTNWNNTNTYLRLYQLVTGASSITSGTDFRQPYGNTVSGMVNPMTASGDVIIGGTSGAPTRLGAGTNGYVLTLVSGVPAWAVSASGFSNPMTTSQDMIVGGASGVAGRLAVGANYQQPTVIGGTITYSYSLIPQNSQSAAYTCVAADQGAHILHPSADTTARTFTIPANSSVAYPIGTAITFVNQNGAGLVTIAITTDTMRLAGAGTTGSRSLAANGMATALKITSTEWIISGTGLS